MLTCHFTNDPGEKRILWWRKLENNVDFHLFWQANFNSVSGEYVNDFSGFGNLREVPQSSYDQSHKILMKHASPTDMGVYYCQVNSSFHADTESLQKQLQITGDKNMKHFF